MKDPIYESVNMDVTVNEIRRRKGMKQTNIRNFTKIC